MIVKNVPVFWIGPKKKLAFFPTMWLASGPTVFCLPFEENPCWVFAILAFVKFQNAFFWLTSWTH